MPAGSPRVGYPRVRAPMHGARGSGYRDAMTWYVILVLVLVGIIMVVAAFLDRRRAREIQRDVGRAEPKYRRRRE